MDNTCLNILVLYFSFLFSNGLSADLPVEHQLASKNEKDMITPLKFPSSSLDPILLGDNPKNVKLPPKLFPTNSPNQNSSGPLIFTKGEDADVLAHKSNQTKESRENLSTETNSQVVDAHEKPTLEQEDMLHSKYNGGQDVDELKSKKDLADEKKTDEEEKKVSGNEKKASEKDEKKPLMPKGDKDPNKEYVLSSNFNKNGPKLMNETKQAKAGESVLESTSKMMAISSSMLSNAQVSKPHGMMEPAQTIVSVLLSAAFILGVGVIGIIVWKKIAMRRNGRDVLINEEDFDEIADMHSFDRAQIMIT